MSTEIPEEGDFKLVQDDLAPLVTEFGKGKFFFPAGLEGVFDSQMLSSDGLLNAIPWEYHVPTKKRRFREQEVDTPIVIAGTTILQRVTADDADPLFWRFIDWSAVRAQLGVSTGRGELAEPQEFVDLNNNTVERTVNL